MKQEFSSGGVIFKRSKKNEILWLVAKSTPSKEFPFSYWRLPKGWLDDRDDGKKPGPLASGQIKATEKNISSAALREVEEEAGVKAKIIRKIGTQKIFFIKQGERFIKFVTYYLMEWKENLSEGPGFETEAIKWLFFEKARKILKYPREKEILDKAKELLDKGIQENLL